MLFLVQKEHLNRNGQLRSVFVCAASAADGIGADNMRGVHGGLHGFGGLGRERLRYGTAVQNHAVLLRQQRSPGQVEIADAAERDIPRTDTMASAFTVQDSVSSDATRHSKLRSASCTSGVSSSLTPVISNTCVKGVTLLMMRTASSA